jgi:hypothetical protein
MQSNSSILFQLPNDRRRPIEKDLNQHGACVIGLIVGCKKATGGLISFVAKRLSKYEPIILTGLRVLHDFTSDAALRCATHED